MRYDRFVRTFFSAIHYRCCYHLLTQLVNPKANTIGCCVTKTVFISFLEMRLFIE